jgi:hypothetical protein
LNRSKEILPLEFMLEPVAGKNRALNRGILAVEGSLVVITDDDAVPSSSFLTAWTNYLDFDNDFGLFGGSIVPLFDVKPPRWLVASKFKFSMMFAERDLAEGPTDAGAIYGGNMAVSKAIFDRGFRFDERIGPNALDSTTSWVAKPNSAGELRNQESNAGSPRSRLFNTSLKQNS